MDKEKLEQEELDQKEADPKENNNQKSDTISEEEVASKEEEVTEDGQEKEEEKSPEEKLKEELAESKDKFLRLYSEFENYRRRTSKERLDLILTSTQDLMTAILPVLDDFSRAESSFNQEGNSKALKEGVNLIAAKFQKILEQKGLKAMKVKQGQVFDADIHEAISQIPAPKKKLKGKIVDTIEDGYYLGEKVIRFAKVVIGT